MKTDIKVIIKLMLDHGIDDAPAKTGRVGRYRETLIPIGNDHTAKLTMSEEAYVALIDIGLEQV